MRRKVILIIAAILFITGIAVTIYPHVERKLYDIRTEDLIKTSIQQYEQMDLYDLYLLMQEYNKNIYENHQEGLSDPFSYEQASFDLSQWGFGENMMGYIEIPAMDIKLPLYLGATKENMKKGAVHLSNTSLPIGGENITSVIAAHRGYQGAYMFQEIERLVIGDEVFVTNFWETLTYRVTEIKVISPKDIEEILIQDGRDLVTLITCHPFRHNYQRYVVYCERGELANVNEE